MRCDVEYAVDTMVIFLIIFLLVAVFWFAIEGRRLIP
jgi:hypothetical protein